MVRISNTIYSRRKRFLPEYRELFAALLNIPDEDVRKRVTDAVNGIDSCPMCKTKSNMMDVATQTEYIGNTTEMKITDKTDDISSKQVPTEKRRRKRKRNCPKVVKTAQHSSTTPVLKQENVLPKLAKDPQPNKILRSDSEDTAVNYYLETYGTNVLDLENPTQHTRTVENIKNQMKVEWDTSEKYNGGLLPIHEAIVHNDLPKLKRQIYVWKFRKCDLIELCTEEGDNPIQLAVKENCLTLIIDELLKEDIYLNGIDDDCNTIIHLAVSHLTYDDMQQQEELLKSFESLLKKVDLKILLQQNNDGITALHMAVKRNKYLMVEKILNVVDERLKLRSLGRPNEPCADQKKFSKHYCMQCDRFDGFEQNELKGRILNATDMKSGCTALFFAMELGYEHIIYLLMAHMCNPTIKNLSGLDAKTYYTDHGVNSNITAVLDKLITLIQK